MSFLGVVIYCMSMDLNSCQIVSKPELFETAKECQQEVVEVVNLTVARGFFARGYCAPVDTGMQT